VRDQATTCRTSDEGPELGPGCDLGIALEVAEGGGRVGPSVKAQNRLAQLLDRIEERFVQGHVKRCCARPGTQDKPTIGHPTTFWCGWMRRAMPVPGI